MATENKIRKNKVPVYRTLFSTCAATATVARKLTKKQSKSNNDSKHENDLKLPALLVQ